MIEAEHVSAQKATPQGCSSRVESSSRKTESPSGHSITTRSRIRLSEAVRHSKETASLPKRGTRSAKSSSRPKRSITSYISKSPARKSKRQKRLAVQPGSKEKLNIKPQQSHGRPSPKSSNSQSMETLPEPLDSYAPVCTSWEREGASEDPDAKLRQLEREKYLETGDIGVFDDFMAPFVKGESKDLSKWVFDKEKNRWRRTDMSTGMIIWGPTIGSFL